MKILGSQFLISSCDGSLFLDSLEEVLNVPAVLVMTSVKWLGIGSVGLLLIKLKLKGQTYN